MDCVQLGCRNKSMYKEAKNKPKHNNNHRRSVILEFRPTISQPALSPSYNLRIIFTFLTCTVCTAYLDNAQRI